MPNRRTAEAHRYNLYLEQQNLQRMQEIRERVAIAEKLKADKKHKDLLRRYAR